jgi:prepilin peptidase CpaA
MPPLSSLTLPAWSSAYDASLLALLLALLAWAALSDGLRFRIPNAASLGIALLYPAHVLASPLPVDWSGALIVAGILFAVGIVLFAKGMVGGGDVKLLSAAALWAGPHLILPLLIVMGLTGGLLSVIAWLLQYLQRVRTVGWAALTLPQPDGRVFERVPYGVAIVAGGAYAAIHLLFTY